jgi:hypothetical protein
MAILLHKGNFYALYLSDTLRCCLMGGEGQT